MYCALFKLANTSNEQESDFKYITRGEMCRYEMGFYSVVTSEISSDFFLRALIFSITSALVLGLQ